jgi:hypothetical protein
MKKMHKELKEGRKKQAYLGVRKLTSLMTINKEHSELMGKPLMKEAGSS